MYTTMFALPQHQICAKQSNCGRRRRKPQENTLFRKLIRVVLVLAQLELNGIDLIFFSLPLTILCHHINLEICAHKHDSRCPFSIFLLQIYVEKCATQNQFRFLPILPRCAGCVCAPECQCHHHIPMKFYTDKHDMT